MEFVIASAVYILVSMLDPITLLGAVGIGFVAARLSDPGPRWLLVLAGAASMVLLLASLGYSLAAHDGVPFRFRWFERFAACALQAVIACQIITWWRARRAVPPAA